MHLTRRDWLFATMCWSELLAARAANANPTLSVLTPVEALELTALANSILPETDTPGAEQAAAIPFIDAALAGFDQDQLPLYRQGLSDIVSQTRRMFPPAARFSDLNNTQRTALVQAIEKTEFFDKLRTHTVLAYFGNPEFGWKLLGRDPAMHFSPPFGFYDAEAAGK